MRSVFLFLFIFSVKNEYVFVKNKKAEASMKNKKKKNKLEPSPRRALICSIRGTAVFLCSALPASLVASLLAYSTSDPGKAVLPIALAALYICSWIAGFAAFKFHRGMPWLTGALCGVLCITSSLLFAFLIPARFFGDFSILTLLLSRLPMLPMSILGSALASVKRKKHRKRR